MNTEGKVIIKLAEFREGFFIRNKTLILLRKNGILEVCKINKPLTRKEIDLLGKNLEFGLRKIQYKIRKGGPIAVINGMEEGSVYYDDLLIMKAEGKTITCHIIG